MIYLASPYSHQNPAVRERRYRAACAATAEMMRLGMVVISPIAHSHVLHTEHGVGGCWETWQKLDEVLIRASSSVAVLMLDGWDNSRGVAAEVDLARHQGIGIVYLPPWRLGVDRCWVAG